VRTIAEVLDWLEKPENEEKIKHLAEFSQVKKAEEAKEAPGIFGKIAGLALRAADKHIDAFNALSECKTAADIAAFKQSPHYNKIKNSQCGAAWANA